MVESKSATSNGTTNGEHSEDVVVNNDIVREDTVVKFKIGDQNDSNDGSALEDEGISLREPPLGKYGRSDSQDTQASRTHDPARHRHISATVQPNIYAANNKMRKTHSTNSLINMANPKLQQRNSGMVLQLMLPNGLQNGGVSFEPNFTVAQDGVKRRRPETNDMSPQNSLFFNSYATPGASPGSFDFPNNMGSIKGPETVMSEAISHLTPTPPEEKTRVTRESLSIQYSLLYAIFIVSFGATIYIVDVITSLQLLKEIFSYYIVCVALLFIIYVMVDVMLYMKKRKSYIEALEKNKAHDVEFVEHPDGGIHLSIPLPEASKLQEPLPHHYCLSTGRHAGSMYLKIGAAVFCLGHLIHCGLILGYQLVYLSSDEEMWHECTSIALLILDFIYPIYSFLLLFFIFKYCNIIINKNIILARFGFMHCMASCLCFWVHTILRETFDALAFYDDDYDYKDEQSTLNETTGKAVRMWTGICDGEAGMAIIYQNFSPYLYPFSVEFNILVVGVLYIVWDSIASCKQNFEHNDDAAERARDCTSEFNEAPEKESNITIHVDCHSSNRGIFAGIVIVIVLIVAIILFFVSTEDERFQEMGMTINRATHLIVICILILAVVWAYFYTTKLDVNHHHISLLDDVLLYICVPMFYLNCIFSFAAAAYFGNGLYIAYLILLTIQVVIQTSFIVDGLRRCSNSRELRQKKPGRELIIFLVISNVALWISMTFEVSSYDDDRYEFYGKVVWSILGHVWLPLMMFYRFHASACLVDMWQYCYDKASH